MSAPCINDTCSITSTIDAITRRLQLDVRVNSSGGLVCTDGLGLGVEIFGDPANANPVDQCFQQLGRSLAGEMWSIPQKAKTAYRGGAVVNIPQSSGSDAQSSNSLAAAADITNPFDCQAEMLLIMQYRIGFSITSSGPAGDHGHPLVTDAAVSGGNGGNMIPYGMQVECRTDSIGVGGNFTDAVVFAPIGGIVPSLMDNSNHRHISYAVTRRTINANATVSLDARANHRVTAGGNVHWFNVDTTNPDDAPTFAERGFTASALAVIYPFNSEATA